MRTVALPLAVAWLFVVPSPAVADIYKCRTVSGVIKTTNLPCLKTEELISINGVGKQEIEAIQRAWRERMKAGKAVEQARTEVRR